jgi:CRISPR-associated protein Cas1
MATPRISSTATSLKELARFTESLSFLYFERAVIERENSSIAAFTPGGRVSVPAAILSALMLGPGTRITHAALTVLAASGAIVLWVGEDGLRFYAAGRGKTAHSRWLGRQAGLWADPSSHLRVVRQMYEIRFGHVLDDGLSLQQIRGMEGVRVRKAYRVISETAGVAWAGRRYDRSDWSAADPVNRALSAANAALYAVCAAGIHSLGCSPALGFIHTGKPLSFVYDIADLYKLETSVPAAFHAARDGLGGVEGRARVMLRDRMRELSLLDRITHDLGMLLQMDGVRTPGDPTDEQDPTLWDVSGDLEGGIDYGGDDPGSGSSCPPG